MTTAELVDQANSPGPNRLWGTDSGSNKDWRTDEDVVQLTAPKRKDFVTPTSTWSWNHGLGFNPIIDAYNESGVKLSVFYCQHTDVNNTVVTHFASVAGYLLAR